MSGKFAVRLCWDFENEERWLNEMAAKGWLLTRHSWGTYRFEPGEPGTWIYRIQLLPGRPGSAASREYLSFLPKTGVEVVSTSMNWVYVRRPAALGAFELFSDLESRIAHYRRVLALFTVLIAALVPLVVSSMLSAGHSTGVIEVGALVIVSAVVVLLAVQDVRLARRVSSLKAQRQVYE